MDTRLPRQGIPSRFTRRKPPEAGEVKGILIEPEHTYVSWTWTNLFRHCICLFVRLLGERRGPLCLSSGDTAGSIEAANPAPAHKEASLYYIKAGSPMLALNQHLGNLYCQRLSLYCWYHCQQMMTHLVIWITTSSLSDQLFWLDIKALPAKQVVRGKFFSGC